MTSWRAGVRSALRAVGYTLHRWPTNRFDGMADALALLRRADYRPRVVVDAGAHMGAWTCLARPMFPEAAFHLIEPQPTCRKALEHLAGRFPGIALHPVAVTEPGVTRVRMVGAASGDGSGAHIARPGQESERAVECPAATLDMLLGDALTPRDRTLLKLDLEGHEIPALRGGGRVLQAAEVVLSEVQFLEVGDGGRTRFAEMHTFFEKRGFDLYDIACLSSRPRDLRLRLGDVIFVRRGSALLADRSWQ